MNAVGMGGGAQSMAEQLVAAERMARDALNKEKKGELEAREDAYQVLGSSLKRMMSSLGKIDSKGFSALAASFGKEDFASAKVGANAPTGSFQLDVQQLAKQHRLRASFATAADTLSAGSAPITLGTGGDAMTIDLSQVAGGADPTVRQLADYINKSADNPGVQASLVNTGNGVELMLSATESGEANRLSISDADGALGSLTDAYPAGSLDARLTIDGITVTSGSNTLEDVIDGVTLELEQTGQSTLKIEEDTETTKDLIKDFVDDFNRLMSEMGDLTKAKTVDLELDTDYSSDDDDEDSDEDEEDDKDKKKTELDEDQIGVLKNDSTIRTLQASLRSTIFESAPNGMRLSDIGIEMTRDGELTIDDDKLDDALAKDADAVQAMFMEDSGYIDKLESQMEPYTQRNGYLDQSEDSIESRLDALETEMERYDDRMEKRYQLLLQQFAAAEQYQLQMLSTSELFYTPQTS